MLKQTLLAASLLSLSHAFVQFSGAAQLQQHPWDIPTPHNLEIELPSTPTSPVRSISTIPSMTTVPIPTATDTTLPFHEQILRWLKKRQGGAPANPGAAQPPAQVTQVSPITTLSVYSLGKPILVPYTQTFAAVPQQWPSPSSGTIGMGTIQGEVGQVKTKREEPQENMVAIQTAAPEVDNLEGMAELDASPSRKDRAMRRNRAARTP